MSFFSVWFNLESSSICESHRQMRMSFWLLLLGTDFCTAQEEDI